MATQMISLEFQFQFLDMVFHVTQQHVDIVLDRLGSCPQISDHKALVGAQMAVFYPGDDPEGPRPGIRFVAKGGEKPLFISRLSVRDGGPLSRVRRPEPSPGCW
jgi:hypothetical protein